MFIVFVKKKMRKKLKKIKNIFFRIWKKSPKKRHKTVFIVSYVFRLFKTLKR